MTFHIFTYIYLNNLFYFVFIQHMCFLPVLYIYVKEESLSLRLHGRLQSFFHVFSYTGLKTVSKTDRNSYVPTEVVLCVTQLL